MPLKTSQQQTWSPVEAAAVLRGLKTVATLRGVRPLDAISHEMLEAVQHHLLHSDCDIEALPVTGADDEHRVICDGAKREQFLQMLILMPYVQMDVSEEGEQIVRSIAAGLDLHPDTLRDLHKVRHGQLKALLMDYGRRAFDQFLGIHSASALVREVFKTLHESIGDPAVAARYQALEQLPTGSLGRTFFQHYRTRGWAFPGEWKGSPELLVRHDCCHILGGFNTDMDGEMNVAAFQAGLFDNSFGFETLLEAILDFHLGKAFSTVGSVIPPAKGHFHPDAVMAAYNSGLACNTNLIEALDFWALADQPVTELRQRFNIPAISGPVELPLPVQG